MLRFTLSIIIFVVHVTCVFSQAKMKKVADLPKDVKETSGLVLHKNKYLITINDGGNPSEIFLFDTKGEYVKTVNVKDTKNRDWEDLTSDPSGRLYIGDFGNNDNSREKCQIYILPPGFEEKKGVKPDKITFTYEDQKEFPPKKDKRNYDCEAFFWKDGYLYLFTKCRTKPFSGESRIYRVPARKGKHKAEYMGSIFLCKSGWRFCSVTAADYDPQTNSIAILTYTKLYILSGFEGNEFEKGHLKSFSLPIVKQREAICFAGKRKLYLTDEHKKGLGGGNLYEVRLK